MRSIGLRIVLVCLAILATVTFFWVCVCRPVMKHWNRDKYSGKLLHKTITALERAINHFLVSGDDINFDGVFGVRLVYDQLKALVHQIVTHHNPLKHQLNISPILLRLITLKENAYTFYQKFAPHPTNVMRYFLTKDSSWDFWYDSREINRQLLPDFEFENVLEEAIQMNMSSFCISEPFTRHCQYTDLCWDVMMTKIFHGYSLTHKIIYLFNGITVGCVKELEAFVQKKSNMTLDQLLTEGCTTVLHEAELIAGRGYPLYKRDLFLEQIAFCGMLGFRNFFRDDWIKAILSWQHGKGCYSINVTEFDRQYKLDFSLLSAKRTLPSSKPHHRRKREEKEMKDGCMAHYTAVAIAALTQYVRYLLEPVLEQQYL